MISQITSTGLLVIASILMISGCGPDEEPLELPDIEYKLVITDSIGVELGEDEYMFIWPVNLIHSNDGNILVVDKLKHTVFVYSPDGVFQRTIGREGEGPGEFRLPDGIVCYLDGRLLVGDADGISMFDSTYEYQGQLIWNGFDKPWPKTAVDNSSFIGIMNEWIPDENVLRSVKILGRWDGEGEPSVEYFSTEWQWDPSSGALDHSENRESGLLFCATRTGRVFYSRSSIDEFVIHCCEPDGTEFLLIRDQSVHRVRKTEEEIQAEIDAFESLSVLTPGSSGPSLEYLPDPYREIIKGMFIDGEDRLWVRLGYYPGIVFRVYNMEGEILFHAIVEYEGNPADLDSWEITGDEFGFLANNTSHEYYHRIYMLELRGRG